MRPRRWTLAAALAGWTLAPAAAQAEDPWTLHEELGAPEDWKISGSLRARYEALDGQFRPGFDDSDDIVVLRSTLFAEYDAGPVRIGAELIDARAYGVGEDSPVGTGEVNALELVQAYVAADLEETLGSGSRSSLTLGRFTLDLGSRRLAGRNNFRNTTNAFTGFRLDRQGADKSQLTLFYTLPQIREPIDKAEILDNEVEWDEETFDLAFWGGLYTLPASSGAKLDLYLFALDEDDRDDVATRNRKLWTPGLRLYRDPAAGKLDYEFEAALQFGSIRAGTDPAAERLDVRAGFAHAEVGYTFDRPWAPRLAVEYDFATGDGTGTRYTRFDSLYGVRRPDWGPTGIYGPLGRANINSPGIRLEVKPDDRWDGFLFYRAAWLDEATDSFASTGVRDPEGRSGRFGGHQVEARARYWIVPKLLRADIGGALLFKGRFLEEAPNANPAGDVRYVYFDLTATF